MRAAALFSLLALVACGREAPPEATPAPEAADAQFVLACDAYRAVTPDELAERFGAENIATQTLPGPEGESYEATIVFPEDAGRRLEVVWNAARTAPASLNVNSRGTQWRAVEGFSVGTPLADIEVANGRPFKLWGFGWDYGGWVSDWAGGALASQSGCGVRLHFDARGEAGVGAIGDSEFSSSAAAIRAADPVVTEFGLLISAE